MLVKRTTQVDTKKSFHLLKNTDLNTGIYSVLTEWYK